jgi:DNA-binding transcriptional LysR family regulator
LRRFAIVKPAIHVSFRDAGFDALCAQLENGVIDLALTYDLGLDESFERRIVGQAIPQAFVAPGRPPDGAAGTSLKELARHPLILFEEGLSIRHVLGLFRRQDLTPRVAHRVRSLELMRSLATHGEGVGISYTRPPVAQSYDGSPLSVLAITDPDAREPLILTQAGAPPSGPAKAAEALIAEAMSGLAAA